MTFLKNVHPLIVQINEKLMEMARGDFNTFIPKSSEQGEIESIAMSVNMLSETLAHRIRQTAYSTKTNADHYFQVFHLQLDEDFIIRDFSTLSCSLLNVPANQLANASIASFLSERSYNNLCTVVKQMHSLSKETVTVSLEFQHHSLPFFYETQVQYSSYTQMFTLHLTAIRFKKFTPETDTPSKSRAEQRDYVERQIQKIHTNDTFVIFDGDQKKLETKIDLSTLPANQQDSSDKLKKLIKQQTGCDIKFYLDGGNQEKEQREKQILNLSIKYLDFYKHNVYYLPLDIPEDIIWDEAFATNLLGLIQPSKSISVILDKSSNSKELLFNFCIECYDSSSHYESTLVIFITNWLNKSDSNYQNIVDILNKIK